MKYTTNLFPRKEQSSLDKITEFTLHYLRYILVITQFVTVCVFFYRFKVDQEIVDLKDTLTQKKAIVETTTSLLELVKKLDLKIKNVKELYNSQDAITNIYTYFFSKIPVQISISTLNIDQNNISMQGQTSDVNSIKKFYEELKADKLFKQVDLGAVNKIAGGYTFSIDLKNFTKKNGS